MNSNINDLYPGKESECCICLSNTPKHDMCTRCRYPFHVECIAQWGSKPCPMCKMPYPYTENQLDFFAPFANSQKSIQKVNTNLSFGGSQQEIQIQVDAQSINERYLYYRFLPLVRNHPIVALAFTRYAIKRKLNLLANIWHCDFCSFQIDFINKVDFRRDNGFYYLMHYSCKLQLRATRLQARVDAAGLSDSDSEYLPSDMDD